MTNRTLSLLICAASLLVGCSSPEEAVDVAKNKLTTESTGLATKLQGRTEQRITWKEAVERMMRDNQELREARAAILTADDQIDRVWLDLLPGTSLSVSLEKGLTDLASKAGNSPTVTVFSFINVGGVIGTRMRYYAASLSYLRACYAYEVLVRERTMSLYRLFRDRRRLDEREGWAKYTARIDRINANPAAGTNPALSEYLSSYALDQAENAHRTALSSLLGSFEANWRADDADLPELTYHIKTPDLNDPNQTGLLPLRVMATELEGARLRALGATLAFWPDLSIGISGPPVYQRTPSGGSSYWDPKAASANFNLAVPIDTKLSALYSLMETKRQVALMRDRMIQQNTLRVEKLIDTKKALEVQAARIRSVEHQFGILRGTPPPANYTQYGVWAQDLRSLLEQRSNLQSDRDELQMLFWFMDEAAWPKPDPAAYAESDKAKNAVALENAKSD